MRTGLVRRDPKMGDPLRFFNIHSVVNYQKHEGDPSETLKIFEKLKARILNSLILTKEKEETLWALSTCNVLQNITEMKGDNSET